MRERAWAREFEDACTPDQELPDGTCPSGGVGGTGGTGGGSIDWEDATDCPSAENGSPTCDAGVCGFACDSGFGDCDGELGCEADLTLPTNCGSCGNVCAARCEDDGCNDPVALEVGYNHTCAILEDQSVWCWGLNDWGELGDGTVTGKSTPTRTREQLRSAW